GTKYFFDVQVEATQYAIKSPGITDVQFQKREFEQFDSVGNGAPVIYNSEWRLSKKQSPSGAQISYQYWSEEYTSENEVIVGIRNYNNSSIERKVIYKMITEGNRYYLSNILSPSTGGISLSGGETLTNIALWDSRKNYTPVKSISFTYQTFGTLTPNINRWFLKSIQETAGCDIMPPYQFTYIGVDYVNGLCNLPDIYSDSKDFWGYYNGRVNASSFPKLYVYPSETSAEQVRIWSKPNHIGAEYILDGADRNMDAANAQIGSLETIRYPTGGSATLAYEANEFYDPAANQTYKGGGLRVKSTTIFDGVNPESIVVKTYSYKDASNVSSGRLINRPVFHIPTYEYRDPESALTKSYASLSSNPANMYEHLLVRSADDLSQSYYDQAVGYQRGVISMEGAGSVEYQFALPATYGASPSGEWSATVNKFVRPSSCPEMGVASSGGTWRYPYTINPNFSHGRGQLIKKIEWNEAGTKKVNEIINSYQYIFKSGSASDKVYGITYDHYPNSPYQTYFYGKYSLLTDVEVVVLSDTIITYDLNDQNKFSITSSDYFFESTYHKLLTRSRSTAADGTIITRKIKYPLDFGSIPGNSDNYLKRIKDLQDNFRNGTPIEQVTLQQKPGEPEKVVGAALVKFSDFGVAGKVLPEQSLSLKIDQGVTNFSYSGQTLEGPTYVLSFDSRYRVDNTFLAFDNYNLPMTSVSRNRVLTSTHWGFGKTVPIVQAVNTRASEFVFSNFETDATENATGNEFQLSGNIYGRGRTGDRAIHPSVVLTKTLQKAEVSNYVLSFWLKKQSSSVTVQVQLKNASTSAVISTNSIVADPAGAEFQHFQKKISMSGVPSTFIVEVKGLGFGGGYTSAPELLPVIDDVSFYPEGADLTTYTYSFPFGPNSVTSATQITTFITYDSLGRQKYLWDQDKNLIQKNTYKYTLNPANQLTSSISGPSSVYDLIPESFTATESCIDGVTYEWRVDTGTWQEVGLKFTPTFSSSQTGQHDVHLRLSHPVFGTVTYTKSIEVLLSPFSVTACEKGAKTFNCSGTVVETYSCASIPGSGSSSETIYKITGYSVSGTETISSYLWEKQIDNQFDWTTVGTTESVTVSALIEGQPKSYRMRCTVTTNTGRIGYAYPQEVYSPIPCN
ncbi:MAG TPA: hypothetical protein DIS90_01825, partial [Cytophagales bacterium]|nr:hypothetical protein [Cytophagales bacterium]